MKVQLHTSPVAQAFLAQDECPFCRLEKEAEQRAIRFFAGPSASYMEPEIRGLTNKLGFCSDHMKKLYDYGNTLGNALMLQSHMEHILLQLEEMAQSPEAPAKKGLFKSKATASAPMWVQLEQRIHSCAICEEVQQNMHRQYQVFFTLLAEPEFRSYVEQSHGFCLSHYARLLQEAAHQLPQKYADWFYPTVHRVMRENLQRVNADLNRFIAKHDYRNAELDWGNAKDAVPRAIQKLAGIDPAAPPYKKD